MCEYKTAFNSNLKRHIITKHGKSELPEKTKPDDKRLDEKYECHLCSYKSAWNSCLKK